MACALFLCAFAAIACSMLNVSARCTFLSRDSIGSNLLGDNGLEEILKGLKHNTTLTTLMWVNQPHFSYITSALHNCPEGAELYF